MTTNHEGYYGVTFKNWQAKQLGAKPTAEMLATVHALGLRPGKQALANAMALRDGGVSGSQIVMATGAPQLNRLRGLIASGVVKREAVSPNEQGHTVYKITLTAKGTAAIKRAADAAAKAAVDGDTVKPAKAKPVKAAGKGKGSVKRKGKVTEAPVQTPTSEAPAAVDAPADQPAA